MSYQNIFQRYEIKYLITRQQKKRILDEMKQYMKPDEFGRSTICNIYYDTPEDLLVRRSLEAPVYKEKLRVRSYGCAEADSAVFLELKKKYKGIVYKRRVCAPFTETMQYLQRQQTPDAFQRNMLSGSPQIIREINYFCQMYQGLAPKVYLSYDREAFYGSEDHELRITFDENIRYRQKELSLCAPVYGTEILREDQILMEVKIGSAMPLWLAEMLSENQIYKTSFSKYGRAYEMICRSERTKKEKWTGGRKYA